MISDFWAGYMIGCVTLPMIIAVVVKFFEWVRTCPTCGKER